MNLQEAKEKAEQILVEEQTNPTVDYKVAGSLKVGDGRRIRPTISAGALEVAMNSVALATTLI
jgi:hypothetical protein